VVSHNTTLVPSLGLRIEPACEAGLSAGMGRERVSPQIRKKEEKKEGGAYGSRSSKSAPIKSPSAVLY